MTAIPQTLGSGLFIEDAVFSASECEELLDNLPLASFHRGRAESRHLMSHPEVRRVASDPRMLRIASFSLGSDALPYRATLFDKSGAANWSVVWHQDTALPLQSQFVCMDGGHGQKKRESFTDTHRPGHFRASWRYDSTSTRQLLKMVHCAVLRGTHAFGVMSDGDVFAMARSRPHVDCIVGRGGVMAMYPLLVHSSRKARSDSPRRVLHIEYANSLVLVPGIQLAVA
jgi:hypothetical protein